MGFLTFTTVSSPYIPLITPVIAELQNAFNNLSERQGDFLADDIYPGERYAILKFESLDYDRDRQVQLQDGRAGYRPFVLRHLIISRTAIDCEGLTENAAQQKTDVAAVEEAFNLHHLVGELHRQVSNSYQIIERFSVRLPLDQGASQLIKDSDTWIVNMTAEFNLHFWLNLDEYGAHIG